MGDINDKDKISIEIDKRKMRRVEGVKDAKIVRLIAQCECVQQHPNWKNNCEVCDTPYREV